jgi:hypothetical protein
MAEATDDNSKLVDMDDLDAFEDTFFNREPAREVVKVDVDPHGNAEEVEEDEVDENEENPLATDEDETPDEDSEDEVEEPKEEKKKSRTQIRIEELVTEARVAQRERDALAAKLNAMEQSQKEVKQEPTLREQLPPSAPSPDAVNERGEPVYPLGEFDPRFHRRYHSILD